MNIYSGEIIKIVQKNKDNDFYCYRVYGLNIYSVNYQLPKEFIEIENTPIFEFIKGLVKDNNIFCLIGYPAIDNWLNDEFVQGNKDASIHDFIENANGVEKVLTSYYDGAFKRFESNEESLLYSINDLDLLSKTIDFFAKWDSFVVFICHKSLKSAKDLSHVFEAKIKDEIEIIRNIIDFVELFVVTKEEGQYLEIYSINNIKNYFIDAIHKSEDFIIKSDWYNENKNNLVWDDEIEHCLIVNPK